MVRVTGWSSLLLGTLLSGLGAPALAGSVSADSVWDRANATQRAMQQVPAGATVTTTRCQEISVGMDNFRYRCTVEYTAAPVPPPGSAVPSPP